MGALVLRREEQADLALLGAMLRESGMFEGIANEAQAAVKVLAGREMGINPVESMRLFHVIGKAVEPTAELVARLVRSHPEYDYVVRELTNEGCTLEFFRWDVGTGEWLSAGLSSFTEEDRERAQLSLRTDKGKPSNWARYPRNMFFARAMTNGVAWFAPDVLESASFEAPSMPSSLLPGTGEAEAPQPGHSTSGAPAVEAVEASVVETGPQADAASIEPAAATVSTEPDDADPEPVATTPAGEDDAPVTAVASSDDPAGAAASGEVDARQAAESYGEGDEVPEGHPASPEHTDDDSIEAITAEVVQLLGGSIRKVTPYCKGQHADWQIRTYSDLTLDQWRELRAELRARAA